MKLLWLITGLALALTARAQQNQGVYVRGTNGGLFATGPDRLALSVTNGLITGGFNSLGDQTPTASQGSIIAGNFLADGLGALQADDGGMILANAEDANDFNLSAQLGALLSANLQGSSNIAITSIDGGRLGAYAQNSVAVDLYAYGGGSLGASVYNSSNINAKTDGGHLSIYAYSKTNVSVFGKNSIIVGEPPSEFNNYAAPLSYMLAVIDKAGVVSGVSSNGFTSDNSKFVKMPTNTPSVGQVISATSTSGHTAWANAVPGLLTNQFTTNSIGSPILGDVTFNGVVVANLSGSSNAVDIIAGSNVTVTTNANKRTFTIASHQTITNYLYLTHPHLADGTGATLGSTTTALDFGHATFSHSADQAANYVQYRFQVPPDLNSSSALQAKLKFRLNAGDTGTHRYVLSVSDVADSAAATGSLGTAINLDFAGDASGASGDVESVGWTALTGWAAALTADRLCVVQLARDGDAAQDGSTQTSTELGLVIAYVSSQ